MAKISVEFLPSTDIVNTDLNTYPTDLIIPGFEKLVATNKTTRGVISIPKLPTFTNVV